MYSLHSVPWLSTLLQSYFEVKLSWMPYQHAWLSSHTATLTAHIMLMAEQCSTLVMCITAMLAQHPRVMLYNLNSCSGCECINIYTTPYTIAWWVSSCPLSAVIYTEWLVAACFAVTFSLGCPRLPGNVVKHTYDYDSTHYLGNVVSHGYGNLVMHSWKNPTFSFHRGISKKSLYFVPMLYHC